MRMMRDCRPQVEWDKARHVSFYVADQTYEWVGMKKRGARNTLERLDPTGMPVAIEHEVPLLPANNYVYLVYFIRAAGHLGSADRADHSRAT